MGIDAFTAMCDRALTAYGMNPVVHSLLDRWCVCRCGKCVEFLPIIVVLFFFLSILEDSGYMARVAFVMDKPLRKIGLSGRSFVPMLIGFGCTVPAVMATRTLSSERDRNMTIMLTPFMSCSAKLPIYGFFTAAFFPKHGGLVMVALYFGGILMGHPHGAFAARHDVPWRGSPVRHGAAELPDAGWRKTSASCSGRRARDFLQRGVLQ